jgi:predicted nucleic acid-binding protein
MIPVKAKAVVVDSWAVIAYFDDEGSAEYIGKLFGDAHESGIPLLMTVINLGEVWYSIARERSDTDAEQSIQDVADLGITIVDADWQLTHQAARFKAKGRIAFADCFAAALAKREHAPVMTGDPEFKPLEKEISIIWL